MKPRAVVFGYHDVGDRCLRVLLSAGWDIPLVVTHQRDANETPWFADVATTAEEYGIPVVKPDSPTTRGLRSMLTESRPDFVFSFYYRQLLPEDILQSARRAALNMHGSLLPRFRGRAPVNWAILSGMKETGATLHHMVARADTGDIVDQQAVPILQDDDARAVMGKITVAAELVLARNLSALAEGSAPSRPQNLNEGEYCGRRTPEDGRIDWRQSASVIHNLVRAIAPPYPGAYSDVEGVRWWIHRTRIHPKPLPMTNRAYIFGECGRCYVACEDGSVLEILAAAQASGPINLTELAARLAPAPLFLN